MLLRLLTALPLIIFSARRVLFTLTALRTPVPEAA